MSELQRFAQQRNWTKARVTGLKANISGLCTSKCLTSEERDQFRKLKTQLDNILKNWDDNYKQSKLENL